MADTNIDGIILEIEATTDKADGGIDKTIKSLESMKKITEAIDPKKLESLKDCLQSFSSVGEQLKSAGAGMRGIASSIKSLSGIDSTKLKEVADAVGKIGAALGNLGSNNKINIRIDSEGIKQSVKPLKDVQDGFQRLEFPKIDASQLENGARVIGQIRQEMESSVIKGGSFPKFEFPRFDTATAGMQQMAQATQQAKTSMDSASASADNLANSETRAGAAAQSAASGQGAFSSSINQTNTSSANAKIQSLIEQINRYKATIRGMENGTLAFDTTQYTTAINGLKQVQQEFDNFKKSVENSPSSMDDLAKSIKGVGDAAGKCGLGTFASLLNTISTILPMIEAGGVAANAGFQSMAVGLQAVQSAIPIIGIILTLISAIVNAVNAAAQKIKSTVEKVTANIKVAVRKVQQALTKLIAKIKEMGKEFKLSIGISDDAFKNLRKKLHSLTRLFTFMLLRKAITHFFELVKTGFDNLVLYSRYFGTEFHKNVNLLYSDLKWVGNAFATAFEPILNYVTPMLDYLIEKLVAAANALAQFFSALTGKATYTRAKKLNEDYAKSLDKTADSAKKLVDNLTTGIDELNILQENKNNGKDDLGETKPEDMFTTEEVDDKYKSLAEMIKEAWENADFYDIGRLFGEKLRDALESIDWDAIKKTLRKIAKCIATFLNGFLETPGLFTVIGRTVAEAINSAFEFIDEFAWDFHWDSLGTAIMDAIEGFVDNLDWSVMESAITGVATGITNLFNTIFARKEVFQKAGDAIANAINLAIKYFSTIVTGLHWDDIGSSIGTALSAVFTGIDLPGAASALAAAISGVCEAAWNLLDNFDFEKLAYNIYTAVNNFLNGLKWEDYIVIDENGEEHLHRGIKSAFSMLGTKLGTWISETITGIDPKALGRTIGNAFNTLFKGIGDFAKSIDFKAIAENIATAINTAVETIDWKDAGGTINTLVNGVCTLINTLISKVDWFRLMRGVGQAMAEIDWDTILATVFRVFAAKWTFKRMFKSVSFTIIGTSIVGGIQNGIDKAFSSIGTWIYEHTFEPIINAIKKAFGIKDGDSEESKKIGGDIIGGFLKGLSTSLLPPPLGVFAVFGNVIKWVKDLFGIHSPSTVFKEIGENVIAGFTNAFNFLTNCKKKIEEWAGKILEWFDGNGLISDFKGYASDIITGFKEKIGNTYTTVKTNITTWASNVKEWFSGSSNGAVNRTTWTNYANEVISGFREKIGNTYTTCRTNITTWASDVKEYFTGNSHGAVNNLTWTSYANEVVKGFREKIGNAYTTCRTNISTWANDIKEYFSGSSHGAVNNSTWTNYANEVIKGFREKIGNTYTTCRNNITTWASDVKDYFSGSSHGAINNTTWTNYASEVIRGFREKIGSAYTTCRTNINTWTSDLKTYFTSSSHGNINSSNWATYAGNIITGFKNKIGSSYTDCKSNIETWASKVKSWFTDISGKSAWEGIAANVVNGFKDKVGALYSTCKSTIQSWGSDIISWFKDKLGIKSPSRVFAQLGVYTIEGFNSGVEGEGEKTKDVMSSWADSFTDMDINLGAKMRFNDSALRDVQTNYGADFTNDTIVQRVRRDILSDGALRATLESGGGIKEAFKEALVESGLIENTSNTAANTKRQADKKEQTIVEIGRRTITDVITTQRNADGFQFQPT